MFPSTASSRQRPIDLVPFGMKRTNALGPGLRDIDFADERLEAGRLAEMGQHRRKPDHFAFAFQAQPRAFHLDQEKARGDVPESGRVQPGSNILPGSLGGV